MQLFLLSTLLPLHVVLGSSINTAETAVTTTLRTNIISNLKEQSTPLPTNTPHICTGVANGGTAKVKTDIYYVLEYSRYNTARYMSQGDPNTERDWTEKLFTPHLPLRELDTGDRANTAIHFRFTANGNNKWKMINGKSGQWVWTERDPRTSDQILVTTGEGSDFTFSTCDANGYVTLNVVGWSFVRFHREREQFAVTAQKWRDTMTTGCCDSCPAGWTRTAEHSMACVFCDKEDCEKYSGPNDYQTVAVQFKVYESPAFYAPDVNNAASQGVATDPAVKYIATAGLLMQKGIGIASNTLSYGSWTVVAGKVVNKFGSLATAATVGLGVLGIALQIAIDLTQPSLQDQLNQLEQKIMAAVGNLITDAISANAAVQASNIFKTARYRLIIDIKKAKKSHFTSNDLGEIDDDADTVAGIAGNINTGLDLIKPQGIVEPFSGDRSDALVNSKIVDNQLNVKLIQQGYLLYVSGVIDMISALSEAVLLNAFAHPEQTCDDIIGDVGLSSAVDRQGFFLQQMASFIVNRRINQVTNNKNPGQYTGWTAKDAFINADINYVGQDWRGNVGDLVRDMRKSELRWDMDSYSYRFTTVKAALDEIVSNTKNLCNKLRTDAAFKTEYINCAKGVGSGCV
jgi:hypothetical protein